MSEWISMSEKWPEQHSRVLIYSDPSEYFAGRFHVARFEPFEYEKGHPLPEFSFPGFGGIRATHWMPLPEPPK